jgi:hypothetical protein
MSVRCCMPPHALISALTAFHASPKTPMRSNQGNTCTPIGQHVIVGLWAFG